MAIEYGWCVDGGRRSANDDRVSVDGMLISGGTGGGAGDFPVLAAVCDGCGGYAGGGTAAELVLQTLAQFRAEALLEPAALAAALEKANRAIETRKAQDPALAQMCSTVAGCVFGTHSLVVFHAGDSRVYRCDRIALARMTEDHSAVQELVSAGTITSEQARQSPSRSVITRCMGADSQPPEIRVSAETILPGETYLLCSDGLWEAVSESRIREILSAQTTPEEKARLLVSEAWSGGSEDNISALVCTVPGAAQAETELPFVLD